MQTNFWVESGLWWVLALVLGFPLVMLTLGEIILRLDRRKQTIVRPVRVLRNWVAPLLALFILLIQVIRLDRTHVIVQISETLLWISVIYAALTLLNVILFEDAPEASWQAKVPQLFRDLGQFVLVLVGGAIVLSSVWGLDLGGLLTALGVGSLVIGLALQDSLGNVFSGISMLFEQPIALGDWVQLGDNLGKVVEINWRSVHLQTLNSDLLVVPNSELAKGTFTNFSRPTRLHVENVQFGFCYDDPPNKVKQVLREVALEVDGVLSNPPPQINVESYEDFAVTYRVQLFTPDYERAQAASKEFKTRVWYAAKRHHLTMPYPMQAEVSYEPAIPTVEEQQSANLQFLKGISGFSSLPTLLLEKILQGSEVKEYSMHEFVLDLGDPLPGLYLILEGQAQLSVVDYKGTIHAIGVLSKGELFGEKSSLLSDQTSDVTVRALEDLRLLLIDTKTLQIALQQSSRLAQELGEIMEIRRRAVQAIQDAA